MVYMRSEKPICTPSRLSEVSPTLPLKQFQCSSDWRWLSVVLSRKVVQRFLFPCLSLLQAIDGVMSLALCPHVVSQAPQHFKSSEMQATYDGCFARQSLCSVVSLHSGMSRAVHPQEFSKVDVDHRHIPVWASHSTFHFLYQAYWICEEDGMCGRTVISWGSPAEGTMGDFFHLHCQAGGLDRICCTVFMHCSRTLLDREAPPWLVVGDWAISVHYEVLRFAVFLKEKLDLWLCFACWPFSTVLSQVVW